VQSTFISIQKTNDRSEHQKPGARIKLSTTVLEEFTSRTGKTVQEFTEEITQSHAQLFSPFSPSSEIFIV